MRRLNVVATVSMLMAVALMSAQPAHAVPLAFELRVTGGVPGSLITGLGTGCPDLAGDEPDGTFWLGNDPILFEPTIPIDSAPDGSFSFTFVVPQKATGSYPVHVLCGSQAAINGFDIMNNPHGRLERWAGADRYKTAARISSIAYAPGVSAVCVASGENYPDGLAGAPVAAIKRSPLLLTRTDALSTATAAELVRLKPRDIIILGGPSAVSERVATQLKALTPAPVMRWAGRDRYSTAAAIAALNFQGRADLGSFVASGQGFADALAGAAAAGSRQQPLLLTVPSSLTPSTAHAMRQLKVQGARILGGTSAVSTRVEQQLTELVPEGTIRLAGRDRYATSTAISAKTFPDGSVVAFIASGLDFPDALAGAAVAGMAGAPVLLTSPNSLSPSVVAELKRLKLSKIIIHVRPTRHVQPMNRRHLGHPPSRCKERIRRRR